MTTFEYDERDFERQAAALNGLDTSMVARIHDHIDREMKVAGKPLRHYRQERWNNEGQRIGPDLRIDAETAYCIAYASEKVAAALREAVSSFLT